MPLTVRVGQGFDVHPFSDDPGRRARARRGRASTGEPGLAGHSDADAIAHAVTDALLGAAGLGDIGQHFPDTDPALAGADSIELLRRAVADVRAAGWEPGNVDCTVVLEAPKLAPRRDEMEQRLTDAVGAPVTVKGKRAEGLGALGRARGHRLLRRRPRDAGRRPDGQAAAQGHQEAGRRCPRRRPAARRRRAARRAAAAGDRPPARRGASRAAARPRLGPPASARASAATRSRVARPCASCCSPAAARCARSGCSPSRTRPTCSTTSSSWPRPSGCRCGRSAGPSSSPRPAARRPRACWPRPPRSRRRRSTTWPARRGGAPPFLVAVDGVTDPGNLGALLRSAECAGATGIVLPRHRAVHVTPTVTKAAAGAVEHLPFAVVGGLPDRPPAALEHGRVGGRPRRRRLHRPVGPARPPTARSRSCSGPRARACPASSASAATRSSASRWTGSLGSLNVSVGGRAGLLRGRPRPRGGLNARCRRPREDSLSSPGQVAGRRYRCPAYLAGLAQLVEHCSCKADVVGSIPTPGSRIVCSACPRRGRRSVRGVLDVEGEGGGERGSGTRRARSCRRRGR